MTDERPCCTPARAEALAPAPSSASAPVRAGGGAARGSLVPIPGGSFRMGNDDRDANPGDGEGPVRRVTVKPFAMSAYAATNDEFAEFAAATGYRTDAERFGWSYVFAGFLPGSVRRVSPRPDRTPWWCGVAGAWWREPEGPGTNLDERGDHPVVHVSWNDAVAFCRWAGVRLATEAEWEYAARGGLDGARYAWGDELTPDGRHMCNIWQGHFPTRNTVEDGHRGTAPVTAFAPNGYGLYNVAGNVWEWCADAWGDGRALRGGSYLCHESYCNRYRVAARTRNTPDGSSGNTGFRYA
ncbi:formylglycine-generating enzyme family protein, partial [Actinomadura sp. CNU-125]|uniref:formylglycine-generating enzyme family protein n=1 Tax=Actinomadura sp. CNU-125 TaxID=1904961 RepID=UPI0009F8C217